MSDTTLVIYDDRPRLSLIDQRPNLSVTAPGPQGPMGPQGPAGTSNLPSGTAGQFLIHGTNPDDISFANSAGRLTLIGAGTTSGEHTFTTVQNGSGDNVSSANLTSANEDFSAVQITGREKAHGSLKINHTKPPSGLSDASASALSLDLKGAGTAAQGIFLTATDGPTTGNLVTIRNNGREDFTIKASGRLGMGIATGATPGGIIDILQTDDSSIGLHIKANSTSSSDLITAKNSAGTARFRIDRTGNMVEQGVAYIVTGLQMGTTSTDFGGGSNVIGMKNAITVPTTNPTAGIIAYAESGILKYRQPSGAVVSVERNTFVSSTTPTGANEGDVWFQI